MPEIISIQGVDILPGENNQATLNIAKLPTRTSIEIPVYVFRGKKDGPVLFLQGGTHGDEINGIEIVRRAIKKNILVPEKGTVIALPLLNIYGFINFSRDVPGGKDVNRFFPGNKRGSLASRVAYSIMNDILIPYVDYCIDFHTGGGNISNYPQMRCFFQSKEQLKLSKAFGAKFIINSKLIDGSLRKETYKKGIPTIVYEGGEALRLDEHAINEGIRGIKRSMNYLGMANHKIRKSHDYMLIKKSVWVRAKHSGIHTNEVLLGDKIEIGQKIGTSTDPFGEYENPIKSNYKGYVIGINHTPVLNQGDPIVHIGMI